MVVVARASPPPQDVVDFRQEPSITFLSFTLSTALLEFDIQTPLPLTLSFYLTVVSFTFFTAVEKVTCFPRLIHNHYPMR